MKSIMDIRKQEEREAFLKLAPIGRLRTMHDRFMQFVALRARSLGILPTICMAYN